MGNTLSVRLMSQTLRMAELTDTTVGQGLVKLSDSFNVTEKTTSSTPETSTITHAMFVVPTTSILRSRMMSKPRILGAFHSGQGILKQVGKSSIIEFY